MKKVFVLILNLFISVVLFAQIPEAEPNNTFETANPINRYEQKTAIINSVSDDYDYFKTVFPEDGTLKIYVQATCTGAPGNGWLLMYGYDRRKTGVVANRYISGSTSIPAGVTVFDTITVYGQAADTFYFRFTTSKTFSYQFSYSLTDLTQNDVEPNNTFATSLIINQSETKQGHTNYNANGSTYDDYDYYRTILPADGTMKIYVQGINRSGGNAWLYMAGYDRRKTGTIFGEYISRSASIAANATIYDTITVYGRAADTVYFRIHASNAFSYQFRYEMVDQSPNDAEPNETFVTALPISQSETKQGHTNYNANGSTYDDYDYYRTILPADGTMKIYVQGINRSGGNAWLYMAGYDRRKTGTIFGEYISRSASIAANATIYDTITVYGRAADTVYFRVYASSPFSYQFRYEMVDQSPNDSEPNNTFATSTPVMLGETKQGHSNYNANGGTLDPDDYYSTVLPYDGTLKLYVEGTNRSGGNAWLYMAGYDRRKTGTIFGKYISGSASIAANATIRDTITVYGRAADTTYYKVYSSSPFAYKLRYEITDTSTADIEPNNTFAQATTLSGTQIIQGHTNYAFNGITEADDYYKTEFGSNDSLKLYVQATNNSGSADHFYLYGYNAAQANIYNRQRFSVPAGATIFDSVKIAVTAPQTIYNRVFTGSGAFSYQLNLNTKLPGNGFSISGRSTACTNATVYKAINISPLDAGVVYHWSITGGGTLNFTDSTATVNWTTAGNYIVKLYISNANGSSVTKQLAVTVSAGLPPAAPAITVKGRYLDIAALPAGATRQWYKDGFILPGVTDSVYYAATAGSYTATYINDCGESPQSAAINFDAPQAQTITFPAVSDIVFSPDSLRKLTATASSGLTVNYRIISGPGTVSNDTLRPTGYGGIVVQAFQYGNTTYGAASPVSITVNVVKGPQSITFDSIPNKIYTANASFALSAYSSSGLAISYSIISGPATINGAVLKMTGAGTVQVKAKQAGNANYQAAAEVTRSFCIGLRQIEPVTGPSPACISVQRYTTKKITGALYQWNLDGGGILTTSGDTAIVQWQTGGNHILSVKGYSACDTVRSAMQNFTIFVDTAYNITPVTGLMPANGSTGLALPLTLQWTASAKATFYDLYVWPNGYTQPVSPLDSNLVQVNYTLNSNIALNTPYNWRVVAKNVCSGVQSAVQQFTVAEINNTLPDLVMDTMYFSTPLYQGQPVTVTWRVKNIGTKGTGTDAWKDRIYLSYSGSIRVSESTLLGVFDNPSYLLPGESYTQTKTVIIPPGYGGTWWLSVITDNEEAFCFSDACNIIGGPGHYNHHSQSVTETNEGNNYYFYIVSILDGPVPDLQVQSVGVPGALFGGSQFTLTYKVKNTGNTPAAGKVFTGCPQRAWRDRFFITTTPDFNISTAKELGQNIIRFLKPGATDCTNETLPYTDYLLPDSSYTAQQQLTIPYEFYGKQYLWVYTNGYNDAYEGSFNTNNLRRTDSVNVTITPPADLVVSSIPNLPAYNSGERVTINYTVANQGANTPLEQSWSDSIWICSSPTFSYANVVAKGKANRNRPAAFGTGNTYSTITYLYLPNGISGTYYVFVKTDAQKEVFEFDQEGNNQLRSNGFIVNLGPLYDLLITAIAAPDTVTAGVPFNLSMTVQNAGTSALASSRWDHLLARTTTTPDVTGNDYILRFLPGGSDTIQPGGQRTYTGQAVISTYSQTVGRLAYIQAKTDATDIIYEHNAEDNNVFVRTTPVFVKAPPAPPVVDRRSNPGIQRFTAPGSIVAGDTVSFNWTIKNKGPLATGKTYWYDRLYLSADTIISNGDVQLKNSSISKYTGTGLQPDSSYTITGNAVVPLTYYGNYYLLLRSDAGNDIENDSTDSDNYYRQSININVPPVPNLVITPLNNLPDSVFGNAAFYLKYKVQNIGTATAGPGWYDRVYIETGTVPYGYGTESNHHNTPLAPGSFYTDSMLIQVPVYLNGNYYFILHTDGRDEIYEGPNGNADNLNVRPASIYPYNTRPAPDLIVQSMTVPDSVTLGKDITATFTIKNNSLTIPAAGNLTNAFYLSSNAIFESNLDKLLTSAELQNVLLQPGQSFQAQLTGKALPPVGGRYRSILRTNSRNTLYEGTFGNNNIRVSDTTTYIEARSIPLATNITDTLVPNYGNYYKVTVAAGQDLLVSLNTAYGGNGSTALYVGYNRVPDAMDYDITGVNPAALNQQALLSNTQTGTYYIRAGSFGIPVSVTATLRVDAIPFSIINVSPAVMGQGTVTGTLRGGGFKPGVQILLRKNGTNYNVATIQQFVNSTQLGIRWNLVNVPLGVYDVVAVNSGGAETVLSNGVMIEPLNAYKLEYTPLLPAEVRPFGGIFTYKGKNIGNVNIPVLQGDITVPAENTVIYRISTKGRIRRYKKYVPQADTTRLEDWYLTGKNKAIPFFGRDIAPGEEFSITVEIRFSGHGTGSSAGNILPIQCRMIGYSGEDFARDQVRTFEMMRLLLANDSRSNQYAGTQIIRDSRAGSKVFIENMMAQYVTAGLMQWTDTIGMNARWDCSRCLQGLPEVKPTSGAADTFTYHPAGLLNVGKDSLGTGQVFRPGESFQLDMNKSQYWWYYDGSAGAPGKAGESSGWDLLDINGTLFVSATAINPFVIYPNSLSQFITPNHTSQLPGWNPAYDASFLIVKASQGINGYDSAKFAIDLTYFSNLNKLQGGHFSTQLRRGYGLGADSIMLVWTAYKPGAGERGVDGVDGGPGQPGSPGGKGGTGDVQKPKGGTGGKGGRGSDQIGQYALAQIGGWGGDGGRGHGSGGDGGDAGESGDTFNGSGCSGAKGGDGEDGGLNGGTGGTGGKGSKGGKGGQGGRGGDGGEGGKGGNGANSSYGGRGGDGGDGGQGGVNCDGGREGGTGGDGGKGGNGPIGPAPDGVSGKKGNQGTGINCPPCSGLLPAGSDAQKEGESLIASGKKIWDLSNKFSEDGVAGVGLSVLLDVLGQTVEEGSPTTGLAVQAVDLLFDLAAAGSGMEYSLACKSAVYLLKVSDYIATQAFGSKQYKGSTVVNFLIKGIPAVSSPADLIAYGLGELAKYMGSTTSSTIVKSCDPNQITGPAGYAQPKFVSRNLAMPYTIDFENDSSFAQVAAQRVVVRQPISAKADPLTFKLGAFGFGGNSFDVPENVSNYFTTLNFDSLGYRVEVTAGVDIVRREAFWIFQTIDPATGLPPTNVFLGLLPVNDSLERGHGFVKYSIKPLAADVTGDSVTVKAAIVFDENEPVETNTWTNIIDAYAPTSSLSSLPATSNNPVVNLRYNGVDDLGGSGLKYVDLYVSDNESAPVLYVANWTGTDTLFYGEQNHTYTFQGQATDNVGNREGLKNMGSVIITANSCLGGALSFTSNISGNSYQWQVNTGSGFTNITDGGMYTSTNSKTLVLINAAGPMYGYQFRVLVNGTTYSDVSILRFATFWEGNVSKAWEDPANWSCGAVPDQYTDVVIPGSKERFPDVNTSVTIRTLRVNTGATVTVKTGANVMVLK